MAEESWLPEGKRGLGQLIDTISTIQVRDQDACSKDVIRRAYKYCLWQTSRG